MQDFMKVSALRWERLWLRHLSIIWLACPTEGQWICLVVLYLEGVMRQIPNDNFFSLVETDIREGRCVRLRMKGSSMFPFLREGKDEVAVCPCKAESLKPMDVVLFRYRGRCLLHRIVGMEEGRFIMQGDGVCTCYEECTAADIIGVLRLVYRGSGRVVSVSSLRWRVLSRLWRSLGGFRKVGLCIFHHILF